ncbi:nuclear transport factor 2 family protein [Pseudomonas marincola]|uniref:nuclear transport factor 2 family protein n=1 Tax=Pseudomonas marincola TaxID=437900 RepID=UPI0008F33D68|nr:nuclear transport factor 2 family protein [Pseudomonas marincola]SFU00714.1 SnoaL-like domain-containing protein [Pseudomonas marincola]
MSDFLEQFARDFNALNAGNLDRLGEMYSDDLAFTDPMHSINGLSDFKAYMREMYANVEQIEFIFEGCDYVAEDQGYLRWTMRFRHPRLAAGKQIEVPGCSHLRWREKVYYHRDYFDAGAMLYEHLPVMGAVINWLKRRLA